MASTETTTGTTADAPVKDGSGLVGLEAGLDALESSATSRTSFRQTFVGKIHQCFGHQYISQVEKGRLKVVHRTEIADGSYEPETDYTTKPL